MITKALVATVVGICVLALVFIAFTALLIGTSDEAVADSGYTIELVAEKKGLSVYRIDDPKNAGVIRDDYSTYCYVYANATISCLRLMNP